MRRVRCLAALIVQELVNAQTRLRLDAHDRLADVALLTCGPLVALGTAGTATHAWRTSATALVWR